MELETLDITQPSGFHSSKYVGISSPSERLHFVPKCLYESKLSRCAKGIQSAAVGEWRERKDSSSEKISQLKTS